GEGRAARRSRPVGAVRGALARDASRYHQSECQIPHETEHDPVPPRDGSIKRSPVDADSYCSILPTPNVDRPKHKVVRPAWIRVDRPGKRSSIPIAATS